VRRVNGQVVGEWGSQHEDAPGEAFFAKANALRRPRNGKVPHAFVVQGLRDREGAVPVCVGLHDGHEVRVGRSVLEHADVVAEGRQVDGGPYRHEPLCIGGRMVDGKNERKMFSRASPS